MSEWVSEWVSEWLSEWMNELDRNPIKETSSYLVWTDREDVEPWCLRCQTALRTSQKLPSSLNVSDQVSHPFKTKGKIIVMYILIFKFLDGNLEDKRFCTEW